MEYTSLSNYLKQEYGEKVYKLSLSSGCTCPNRDGFIGFGGCIFCSAGGSGEFAAEYNDDVNLQIEAAKERIKGKAHADSYIAYFQSYTNTYARDLEELARLRRLYIDVVNHPQVRVLSIATRPDCLQPEILEMLSEINSVKPVWVELGLQTSKSESIEYIGRGYENEVYVDAVRNLNALGIKVVTHIIIGLPGETYDDMEKSVRFACDCGTWGLKLQLLHVLRGTDLEKDFDEGKFETLELDEYTDIISRILKIVPKKVVIHRLTGDGPKNLLVSPTWSGDKKRVLNNLLSKL